MSFVFNYSQQLYLLDKLAFLLPRMKKMLDASCCFDFRYQYALHTTSFEEQPVSERTLIRFRTRLASYKLTTGTDLVHECFVKMTDDIRKYMDISPSIKRMDSMMI